MEPADVLASLRPLVITVDGIGVIRHAFGGYGGFLGIDLDKVVGSSMFEFLPPSDGAELAQYLVESAGESFDTVSLPLPFRVGLFGGDGRLHAVDVIVAGHDDGDGTWSWVATLVPASLEAAISRPLDAMVERQPRERVKELLAEELAVDNEAYSSRGFLVDLAADAPTTTSSRDEDRVVADAIDEAVSCGWAPWSGAAPAETLAIDVDEIPEPLRTVVRERGWRRASATPVWLEGRVVVAYVVMGKVPAGYPVHEVRSNVAVRYQKLARMTALILGAWRDRDRLEWAATHDALTGLANRHAFDAAVGEAAPSSALLFIDVDEFKAVNDECGHAVGDQVLAEIARRIRAAAGEHDVVARIGGDEFAVLLRPAAPGRVDDVAAEIRTAMRMPWRVPGGPSQVAVSVGIVSGVDAADALAMGSHAMRREKRRRRRAVAMGDGVAIGDGAAVVV